MDERLKRVEDLQGAHGGALDSMSSLRGMNRPLKEERDSLVDLVRLWSPEPSVLWTSDLDDWRDGAVRCARLSKSRVQAVQQRSAPPARAPPQPRSPASFS